MELGVAPEKIRTTGVLWNFRSHRIITLLQRYCFPHGVSDIEVSIWQQPRSCGWSSFHLHGCHMGIKTWVPGRMWNQHAITAALNFLGKSLPTSFNASCENLFLDYIELCIWCCQSFKMEDTKNGKWQGSFLRVQQH